jgi:hypothetical protein
MNTPRVVALAVVMLLFQCASTIAFVGSRFSSNIDLLGHLKLAQAFCDQFGNCCDQFGNCCDQFGNCVYYGPPQTYQPPPPYPMPEPRYSPSAPQFYPPPMSGPGYSPPTPGPIYPPRVSGPVYSPPAPGPAALPRCPRDLNARIRRTPRGQEAVLPNGQTYLCN